MSAAIVNFVANYHQNRHCNAEQKGKENQEVIEPWRPSYEETRVYSSGNDSCTQAAEDDANVFQSRSSGFRIDIIWLWPRGDHRRRSCKRSHYWYRTFWLKKGHSRCKVSTILIPDRNPHVPRVFFLYSKLSQTSLHQNRISQEGKCDYHGCWRTEFSGACLDKSFLVNDVWRRLKTSAGSANRA